MFIVMAVQRKAEIDLFGKHAPIDLTFATGMIGVLPVFKTRKHAEKYAGKNIQIVEVGEKYDER